MGACKRLHHEVCLEGWLVIGSMPPTLHGMYYVVIPHRLDNLEGLDKPCKKGGETLLPGLLNKWLLPIIQSFEATRLCGSLLMCWIDSCEQSASEFHTSRLPTRSCSQCSVFQLLKDHPSSETSYCRS